MTYHKASTPSNEQTQLPCLTPDQLQHLIQDCGKPAFLATQITDWRNKGTLNPAEISNISNDVRQKLDDELMFDPLKLIRR